MKRHLTLALAVAILAIAPVAAAANNPSTQLDVIATSVAGKPVTVWCETSWPSWLNLAAQNGVTEAGGFTYIGGAPVVYVAPDVCVELHALADHEDVGAFFAAEALRILAHESVHQSGVSNEATTDCKAVSLVPTLATKFFGVPAKVTQRRIVLAWRRLAGRRVRVPTVQTRMVPNPYLARLKAAALKWHDAQPAQYHGDCG